MSTIKNNKAARSFWQNEGKISLIHLVFICVFLSGIGLFSNSIVKAQSSVSGGFSGQVLDKSSKTPLSGATVRFTNQSNGFGTAKRSDDNGNFQQTTLQPGVYQIVVTLEGYKTETIIQELYATRSNQIVPVPVELEKETVAAVPTPTPSPGTSTTLSGVVKKNPTTDDGGLNPRRGAAFKSEVQTLPLGGTTLTRTFDELAFLAPGVAPPPQAIGNSVGPGVGGGVGTSGQFAVNGLRSRANNFTVDGSDNNDEDIGVRRQGFFTLVPQPIESIEEFSIITLLAPAEFGRNLGAQVNALSKSGGNQFHGTIFGFGNGDYLNSRNFFDTVGGNSMTNLQAVRSDGSTVPVFVDGQQKQVFNDAVRKDTFTLLQGGFAVGGPIAQNKMFFFVSGEGQFLNGSQERNFAVPTVAQRGFDNAGASGLQQCLSPNGTRGTINNRVCMVNGVPTNFTPGFPTSVDGDAVFSLFPFANNPNGIFKENTYTQTLSTDARGRIFSVKYNWNIFKIHGNQQIFTARYNYTDDKRDLTDVGGAIFSAIRPLVRTDNFSTYLTGSLTNNVSNEFRFSFGHTNLRFDEIRDASGFIIPIERNFDNPDDGRFLLNARLFFNNTLPGNTLSGTPPQIRCNTTGCFSAARVDYDFNGTTEKDSLLGPIGQLIVAGFSPVGVDVFNFPQERKNNTYQFADVLRWQVNQHSLSFGTDIRRTFLDSNLPRNFRPLVTFQGGLLPDPNTPSGFKFGPALDTAAAGASSGFFQSLVSPGKDARINLGYYQLNFFAQDEWRVLPNLSVSYGLRYEYNTTPVEADNKIEDTFSQPIPSLPFLSGLSNFIDGRTKIFDADKNNFAPRIGFAYGVTGKTVVRGGYGLYYDQILGAVVSQSRNQFPNVATINFGGGVPICFDTQGNVVSCGSPQETDRFLFFNLFNPLIRDFRGGIPIVQPGTINTLNRNINLLDFLTEAAQRFPSFGGGSSLGATLPQRNLETPVAHQYHISVEQKLFNNTFLSVGYVGTTGRNLLRFTTPNLGANYIPISFQTDLVDFQPTVLGATVSPDRPINTFGPISQFETTGQSQYHSLQIQLRGNLSNNFRYQTNYVYGKVEDDVSDVFDLAGAYALPQNSITPSGEYAVANFDVRHRFTYNFIYDLPGFGNRGSLSRNLFGGWQVAGTGKFNTGQPFTVNSIYDVNLDGNLTDRLDNTQFITETGDRRQPLNLTCNPVQCQSLLAAIGEDGSVPRNSFRAGSILDLDLSFVRRFALKEAQNLQFRVDVFNFINRANFGIPVRILESPGFGQATETITPGRRFQFAVKYIF